MSEIRLVAAIDDKLGLARKGKIPWNLPSDRRYWRALVHEGPVVMGWNTYVANKYKPFGEGKNVIFTRQRDRESDLDIMYDANKFFRKSHDDYWVLGGGQIFHAALPFATQLYLTRVQGDFKCDVFFPEFEDNFVLIEEKPPKTENGISFQFQLWQRRP